MATGLTLSRVKTLTKKEQVEYLEMHNILCRRRQQHSRQRLAIMHLAPTTVLRINTNIIRGIVTRRGVFLSYTIQCTSLRLPHYYRVLSSQVFFCFLKSKWADQSGKSYEVIKTEDKYCCAIASDLPCCCFNV